MKTQLLLPRAAFLALALGLASITASFAQSTDDGSTNSTAPSEPSHHHHHDSILTADEKAQLKSAYEAAIAANPDLKTQEDNLKQQRESLGSDATADQKEALWTQFKAFHTQLNEAMVKADPTVAPILAKLEAARKHWHHRSDDSDNSGNS